VEAKDWAEVLASLRREILKIAFIIISVSSIFFAFGANWLINRIIMDLFPAEATLSNRDRILEISFKLQNISDILANYAYFPSDRNMTAALNASRELVRIAMELTTSPILLSPLEGLLLNLKISLAVGVAVAVPYILSVSYKTLKQRTDLLKNVNLRSSTAVKYLAASSFLFVAGIIYGYYMMKLFLRFLYITAVNQGVTPLYSLSEFVSFVALMLVLFGFVFQLPVVMFFLVRNKIVSYDTLKYYRRHIYVGFFVIGAITTPPDVFTQIMVAVPMVVFFEASLLFVRVFAMR
jgi:sec-independent protein translocase protein TatC